MKKIFFLPFALFSLISSITCYAQTITTITGTGTNSFSGDGSQATDAEVNSPLGVAVDAFGNIYIADEGNSRVRVINSSGIISTFAGSGIAFGYSGDGGPATNAELPEPWSVAVGASGKIYIGDIYNNVVRMVNLNTISRFAGIGTPFGYAGDGGQATAAEINYPTGLAVDPSGNVYIADQYNNRIRKVNTSGIISTIAGNDNITGYSGDGGLATAAEIYGPTGVAVDVSGNVYFPDCNNQRVRKINSSGIISTIVGNGTAGFSGDGGPATAAELNGPIYVEVDTYGNVYIADVNNNRIRRVNTSGIITTIVGNGIAGYSGDGGPSTNAEINAPHGIALDSFGNLYIADPGNSRIRKVSNVTGIDEVSTSLGITKLFPNPNSGIFTIESSVISDKSSVEIYNMLGEKTYTSRLNSGNTQINLSNKPEGIYLYRILTETGQEISEGKFIIQ
jgi:sugar lactone lactonase YvrE